MNVILNESQNANLYPFSTFHLNFELRIGAYTLRERLLNNKVLVIDYKADSRLLREKFFDCHLNSANQVINNTISMDDLTIINKNLLAYIEESISINNDQSLNFEFDGIKFFSYIL